MLDWNGGDGDRSGGVSEGHQPSVEDTGDGMEFNTLFVECDTTWVTLSGLGVDIADTVMTLGLGGRPGGFGGVEDGGVDGSDGIEIDAMLVGIGGEEGEENMVQAPSSKLGLVPWELGSALHVKTGLGVVDMECDLPHEGGGDGDLEPIDSDKCFTPFTPPPKLHIF